MFQTGFIEHTGRNSCITLTPENAIAYLRSRGFNAASACELGGGVSNIVIRANGIVLKQSLGRLRVEQEWLSDRDRVFRESAALRGLAPILRGSIPEVLFEDRENYLFAMTAAPEEACTWKSLLLAGKLDAGVAASCGAILGKLVSATWKSPEWEDKFGDQTVFRQLRIDPYYRTTALRNPDLASRIEALSDESAARHVSLVHGDWSPKNILVSEAGITAIDFEVIHFGDPAFDAAFLLNHLLLKSFHLPQYRAGFARLAGRFWDEFTAALPADADWMESATLRHLGALLLARIDGKSPAEYLQDEAVRGQVRAFARDMIIHPPATVAKVFAC